MKKIILYLCFVLTAFTAAAQASELEEQQPNPKREEKIKALYVAYITQQLNLSPEDAQKFWPMHAQYDAELKAINNGNANELDRQQAVLNVKKKYVSSFNKILGNERCNNFYKQDGEFRRKLVERLKQMRQQRNMNRPQGEGRMRKNMQPGN
jgi:Skp family chaperone for outer membrane proteins